MTTAASPQPGADDDMAGVGAVVDIDGPDARPPPPQQQQQQQHEAATARADVLSETVLFKRYVTVINRSVRFTDARGLVRGA